MGMAWGSTHQLYQITSKKKKRKEGKKDCSSNIQS